MNCYMNNQPSDFVCSCNDVEIAAVYHQVSTMQATRGRTTDIEQQNLTVPAKKRSGFLADVAEVGGHSTTSLFLQHACASLLLLCNNKQHRYGLSALVA